MRAEIDRLEERIGYSFRDRGLMLRALSHSSHVREQSLLNDLQDNEQLEFLGDAILGFLVSEALVRHMPAATEGRLSKVKSQLVSATHLFDVATQLELGEFLLLGRGEEMSGGRVKKTLLVDALEALIAAMYLDGGLEPVRSLVEQHVLQGQTESELQERVLSALPTDYKGALQELTQARKLPPPRYSIVRVQGPEHLKTFTVEVRVGPEWVEQAEGLTKKSAAQLAARSLIARLTTELSSDVAQA